LFGKEVAGAESKNKSKQDYATVVKKQKKNYTKFKRRFTFKISKIPRCNGFRRKKWNISGERNSSWNEIKKTDNTKILYKFGFISN
jgi:hypothetical protein